MSLLHDIQDAAIDSSQPVVTALRGAVALAERLNAPVFREWSHYELNGYSKGATLPSYRIIKNTRVGIAYLCYGFVPMPRMIHSFKFTEEEIPRVDPRVFYYARDSVVSIEHSMQTTGGKCIQFEMSDDDRTYLRRYVRVPFFEVDTGMSWEVPRVEVVKLLDGVRQRLLQLAIQIEREAPEAGATSTSKLSISSQRLAHIANTIIYAEEARMDDHSIRVHGTAGNIAGGENNITRQRDVLIAQQAEELSPLISKLRTAVGQLPPQAAADIEGLLKALTSEATSEKPSRSRMRDLLSGIGAMASTTGVAGAAVIDAVQAIQHSISG